MTYAVTPALPRSLLLAAAAAALCAPASAPAATETPALPTETARALTLDVETRDGMIEVRLTGLAPEALAVSYTIEVQGNSTSRHRGATTLAAGVPAVLSTMRTSAGGDWCVTLVAEEAGGTPYEITRGACPAE
jgi:hypothetical protein